MKRGISGSTLKLIAILTMLIDHIGAVVLARVIQTTGNMDIYNLYTIFRKIGRMAFPIFCFLLVEGFVHTSNVKKYAFRLGCFAILSEIPFDLAFRNSVANWEYQNVFLTLFFGIIAMLGYGYVEEKMWQNRELGIVLQVAVVGVCAYAAEMLHTDYGATGVLCIMFLYVLRQNRIVQVVAGSFLFLENWTAIFGFLLTLLYNGKRGLRLKYLFYIFYPVHLLILYGICHFMGVI